jgi:hypothetical protein
MLLNIAKNRLDEDHASTQLLPIFFALRGEPDVRQKALSFMIKRTLKPTLIRLLTESKARKWKLSLDSLRTTSESFETRLFLLDPEEVEYRLPGTINATISEILKECFILPKWSESLFKKYKPHPAVGWAIRRYLSCDVPQHYGGGDKFDVSALRWDRVRSGRYKTVELQNIRLEQTRNLIESMARTGFSGPSARPTSGNPDVIGVAISSRNRILWVSQGDHRLSALRLLRPGERVPVKIRGISEDILRLAMESVSNISLADSIERVLIARGMTPLPENHHPDEESPKVPLLRPGEK